MSGERLYWRTHDLLVTGPKDPGVAEVLLSGMRREDPYFSLDYAPALGVDEAHAYLLYGTQLRRIPLPGGELETTELPVLAISNYTAYGHLLVTENEVYVTVGCSVLLRVSKDFGQDTLVRLDVPDIETVDARGALWLDDSAFYCAHMGSVVSASRNLSEAAEIVSLPTGWITGIAADETNLYLLATVRPESGGISPQQLMSVPKEGGDPTMIAEGPAEESFEMHFDSERMTFYWVSETALVVLPPDGGLQEYADSAAANRIIGDDDRVYWTSQRAIMNMRK
jgi:hypothetical protein